MQNIFFNDILSKENKIKYLPIGTTKAANFPFSFALFDELGVSRM